MLLKVKEASVKYGIPLDRLYTMIRSGKIQFVRLGLKSYRLDSKVLEKWISGKCSRLQSR